MVPEKMSFFLKMSRLVALLGSALTLLQSILLASRQPAICLNDGCAVVDSLTTVPPLVINIAGFVFFQTVFWGLWLTRGDGGRRRGVNAVLLAGLAAEGVLVGFQHYVAQTFCSYCLIVLALIVLLNLLAGFRHILAGVVVFGAVLASFASLQFGTAAGAALERIDQGRFATLEGGAASADERYLFFSSTCRYCEELIDSLKKARNCTVNFNPIDRIEAFALSGVVRHPDYRPGVNSAILQSFGIEQIPALLVRSSSGVQVLVGVEAIGQRLAGACFSAPREEAETQHLSGSSQVGGFDFLAPADDACSVETDCEPEGQGRDPVPGEGQ